MQFTVGLKAEGRVQHRIVEAEDALIAALKVKCEHPEALILYVRRQNRRGDARHPPLGSEPQGESWAVLVSRNPTGDGSLCRRPPAREECSMARCDVCGNDYDKAFRVTQGDRTMTFDSFECAIEAMAPRCAHCECRVIGHGVEADGKIYCCAHCAKHEGVEGVIDRAA
jgi:hypothetical protein